ncbi:MAG: putative toxin-antitoxin system toxin component, PIN family [Candidatus Bipolaricaulia bacterium]
MDPFTAFLDSNVLYPSTLRDLLMRLALRGLFRAKWSDDVHEEWIQAVLRDYPDITRDQLERTRALMDRHSEDSLVTGYQPLTDGLQLPDPNDRHVLAAAICARADVIVTGNLKHFPQDNLDPFDIEAQHPDMFIGHLVDLYSGEVVAAAQEHRASLNNPPKDVDAYLDSLERAGLTHVTAALRKYASEL